MNISGARAGETGGEQGAIIIENPSMEQGLWVFWSYFWRSLLFFLLYNIIVFALFFLALGSAGVSLMSGNASTGGIQTISTLITLISIPLYLYLCLYLPISALINKNYIDFRVALLPAKNQGVEVPPVEKNFGVIVRVIWSYFWRVTLFVIFFAVVLFFIGTGVMIAMDAGQLDTIVLLIMVFFFLVIAASLVIMAYVLKKVLNKDYGYFQVRFTERKFHPDVM